MIDDDEDDDDDDDDDGDDDDDYDDCDGGRKNDWYLFSRNLLFGMMNTAKC